MTQYAYDIYHRLWKITDPENGATYFTYDDAGNRLTLTDPEGNVTSWAYDGLGRVTMETNELNQTRSFYYDASGRLTRTIDRNGRTRQFEYDDLDRMTAEHWYVDGTPAPGLSIATTTDGGVTNETQRVGFTGQIFGGTFTLTVAGETTSALAYEASASAVLAALEALPNIEPGDVSVTKTQDNMMAQEWTLSFAGNLAGTNVAQSTIDTTSVMGFMITEIEATVTSGGVAYNEVQTVTPTNANGGFFRLAFQGRTTKPLDHD